MQSLLDELLDALTRMVVLTCPSMRPLWLGATVRQRRAAFAGVPQQRAELPDAFASWAKAKRSKYQALALFRHTVVWRVDEARWNEQTRAGRGYFTPCADEPPFTNTAEFADGRSAGGALEREALRDELAEIITRIRELLRRVDFPDDLKRERLETELLERATRTTLRDVLKLDVPRFDDLFVGSGKSDRPRSGKSGRSGKPPTR